MHLHQPDWKSGVGAVDGRVDARHDADRAHAPDGRRTCRKNHLLAYFMPHINFLLATYTINNRT